MPSKKKTVRKMTFKQKCTYIFEAFITMEVVHFFSKPFKRGWGALNKRLKSSSKRDLRVQLTSKQQKNTPRSRLVKRSSVRKRSKSSRRRA